MKTKHTDLELFRDWCNNWLSVARFAEHYSLTLAEANAAIDRGRDEHNAIAEKLKAEAKK